MDHNTSDQPLSSTPCLLGAVAGDMIGSPYEHHIQKSTNFPLFSPRSSWTDDTVMTLAVAEAIINQKSYKDAILEYGLRYPHAGYGGYFSEWLRNGGGKPYHSFGNGSAMRVSPVGWAYNSIEDVLSEAQKSAEVTHNHPEGIKGAQAIALAIFLARVGYQKNEIRKEITDRFGYDLSKGYDDIQPGYEFDVTCQGTVPAALIAFFDSTDFEDAVRKAVALGGDADTLAAITGSVAEAFYRKIPTTIITEIQRRLPQEFWQIMLNFSNRFYR